MTNPNKPLEPGWQKVTKDEMVSALCSNKGHVAKTFLEVLDLIIKEACGNKENFFIYKGLYFVCSMGAVVFIALEPH